MAFVRTSSRQEATSEGTDDRTLEQMFDHTQRLHWQDTAHPDDDLKNTSCPVKKKDLKNWIHFDLDNCLHKEDNDWESEMS